mgnify:CR=1 FL=1
MDRRTFVQFGALASGVLLARQAQAQATDPHAGHHGPMSHGHGGHTGHTGHDLSSPHSGHAGADSASPQRGQLITNPVVAPGGQRGVITPNGSTLPLRTVDGERWHEVRVSRRDDPVEGGELLLCASKVPEIEPFGCAVCLVEVIDCRPMRRKDWRAACIAPYAPAFGWHLANIRPVPPIQVRGRLQIFTVELPDLLQLR